MTDRQAWVLSQEFLPQQDSRFSWVVESFFLEVDSSADDDARIKEFPSKKEAKGVDERKDGVFADFLRGDNLGLIGMQVSREDSAWVYSLCRSSRCRECPLAPSLRWTCGARSGMNSTPGTMTS